jgi:Zn-dependent peptidase ImmA (M78 family)
MAVVNPWDELNRRTHLRLVWRILPDGMGACWMGNEIHLDPRLDRVERRCCLAHELIHDERRIGWPFATAATMEAEERQVRRLTAEWLVPRDDLLALVEVRSEVEPVTAELVAAEFDVTVQIAATALRYLQGELLEAELLRAARGDNRPESSAA